MAAAASPAFAKEVTPPGIGTREAPFGTVYMTDDGYSLYVYDNDTADKSACTDRCAVTWPPLIAPDDAQPVGEWTLLTRPDGKKQWSFEGKPVYKYQKDPMPSVAFGEGIQDVWHLAAKLNPRPRDVTYHGALIGRVAANLKGMTLYSSDKDSLTSQACTASCLRTWMPLKAPEAALPLGDWTVVQRSDDGTPQWAYKGKPVYLYAEDVNPGDTAGDGVDKIWHPVVMETLPSKPDWVTVQSSEFGPIFANAQGKTLYYLAMDRAAFEILACPDACIRANFQPVLADDGVKAPGGSWTIADNIDGKKQWAYRGELVFTFAGDKSPGDINGEKFGIGTAFATWEVLQQAKMIPPVM